MPAPLRSFARRPRSGSRRCDPTTRPPPPPFLALVLLRPASSSMFDCESTWTATSSLRLARALRNHRPATSSSAPTPKMPISVLPLVAARLLHHDALDGGLFCADVPGKTRIFGERRELLPVFDGAFVLAQRVAHHVDVQERVRGDLLQQLDGAERTMVHAVFHDDVAGATVALEARLERRQLARGVAGNSRARGLDNPQVVRAVGARDRRQHGHRDVDVEAFVVVQM